MRRRDFIRLGGGAAAAWPLAAGAQQAAIPVIGWVSGRNLETEALVLPPFHKGLSAHGYAENRNVTIDYRFADGRYDRVAAFVSDFVRRPVSVIVAVGTGGGLGARLAQAATSTIPIVFNVGGDPVATGLVPSLNRPGGNMTGVTSFFSLLGSKRIGLLHDLLPHATRIAVLVNPTGSGGGSDLPITQDAARSLGLQINVVVASTEGELDAAFSGLLSCK
jgi:putative ABC transport system substrate-binding protein